MLSQGKEFEGRIALVTGGSRGIGRAVCLALAREGTDIALNHISYAEMAEQRQRNMEALGVRCTPYQADISHSLAPRGLMLPYSTSKAAVIAFARSCGQVLAPHVRFNSLASGLI